MTGNGGIGIGFRASKSEFYLLAGRMMESSCLSACWCKPAGCLSACWCKPAGTETYIHKNLTLVSRKKSSARFPVMQN